MQRVCKCSARLRDDNRSETHGLVTYTYDTRPYTHTHTHAHTVDGSRRRSNTAERSPARTFARTACARIGTPRSIHSVYVYTRYVTPFTHHVSVAGGSEPRLSAFRGEATAIVTRHALPAHLFAYIHRA